MTAATPTPPVHDLLLALAGRLDDDLLAWARELLAVGEEDQAVELATAALVAERVVLPPTLRAALVAAAQAAHTDLDVDGALPPGATDGGTPHRFDADAAPADAVVAALSTLPPRRLAGCTLRLTWRRTPAGAAPGPLPRAVVLVAVDPGRAADVLAYTLATELDRAGVPASVEVFTMGAPLPAYHTAALRDAREVLAVPGAPAAAPPVAGAPVAGAPGPAASVPPSAGPVAAGPTATPAPADPTTPDTAPGAEPPDPGPAAAAAPVPAEPVPAEPVPAEPVPAEPTRAEPMPADPVRPDPRLADPIPPGAGEVPPAAGASRWDAEPPEPRADRWGSVGRRRRPESAADLPEPQPGGVVTGPAPASAAVSGRRPDIAAGPDTDPLNGPLHAPLLAPLLDLMEPDPATADPAGLNPTGPGPAVPDPTAPDPTAPGPARPAPVDRRLQAAETERAAPPPQAEPGPPPARPAPAEPAPAPGTARPAELPAEWEEEWRTGEWAMPRVPGPHPAVGRPGPADTFDGLESPAADPPLPRRVERLGRRRLDPGTDGSAAVPFGGPDGQPASAGSDSLFEARAARGMPGTWPPMAPPADAGRPAPVRQDTGQYAAAESSNVPGGQPDAGQPPVPRPGRWQGGVPTGDDPLFRPGAPDLPPGGEGPVPDGRPPEWPAHEGLHTGRRQRPDEAGPGAPAPPPRPEAVPDGPPDFGRQAPHVPRPADPPDAGPEPSALLSGTERDLLAQLQAELAARERRPRPYRRAGRNGTAQTVNGHGPEGERPPPDLAG